MAQFIKKKNSKIIYISLTQRILFQAIKLKSMIMTHSVNNETSFYFINAKFKEHNCQQLVWKEKSFRHFDLLRTPL